MSNGHLNLKEIGRIQQERLANVPENMRPNAEQLAAVYRMNEALAKTFSVLIANPENAKGFLAVMLQMAVREVRALDGFQIEALSNTGELIKPIPLPTLPGERHVDGDTTDQRDVSEKESFEDLALAILNSIDEHNFFGFVLGFNALQAEPETE